MKFVDGCFARTEDHDAREARLRAHRAVARLTRALSTPPTRVDASATARVASNRFCLLCPVVGRGPQVSTMSWHECVSDVMAPHHGCSGQPAGEVVEVGTGRDAIPSGARVTGLVLKA